MTAHQERFIHVWNLSDKNETKFDPIDVVQSPLKFETTSICCFADGKGFVIGSNEGRCGVQHFDFDKYDLGKNSDYCFKAHRYENHDQNFNKNFT